MTPDETGRLPDNILLFCRTLRSAGLPVGPAQVIDALRAVARVGIEGREDVRIALRATLLKDPAQSRLFNQAFHIYFRNPQLLERILAMLLPGAERTERRGGRVSRRIAEAMSPARIREIDPPPGTDADQAGSYSHAERLKKKDFEDMSLAEQREAARLMRAEFVALQKVRSRRFRQHALGDRPDLRRSMQLMMRRDGQLLTLARKRRRTRPPVLVLLCDISGSMSRYSRMFLQFAHVLSSRQLTVHSFVFGTRLTNVTRRLRVGDADRALALVAAEVEDWDGGTRIAACLRRFNLDWGRRVLAQNGHVILLSDGLERDTNADLEFQIARLHRSCRQLIWLNPMLRYEQFEPRAFGIRTMLPYVDLFLPAHNVDSFGDIARALAGIRRLPPASARP